MNIDYNCYLSIQIPCDKRHRFTFVSSASDNIKKLKLKPDKDKDAFKFIEDCSHDGFYIGSGTKGDVFYWGCISNHVHIDKMIKDITPFIHDLFMAGKAPIFFWNKFIILCQYPDSTLVAYTLSINQEHQIIVKENTLTISLGIV